MDNILIDPHDLEIHAAQAEVVTWQGREALRLEDGLALAPGPGVRDASIEVLIGTEGPAFPGAAFRLADVLNYELAYAVPHVSGQWDAMQYDPVFHGSNTWQIYHGPGYQREAQVPTGRWFRLRLDFCGTWAAVSVDGQPSLVVEQLAHRPPAPPLVAERFGLWTYQPAYFSDLRISSCERIEVPRVDVPRVAPGVADSWFVEGFGVVACEAHGVVNLNRYLPVSAGKARLVRRFETSEEQELAFEFGFSDALSLELDGDVIYEGENIFSGFADRPSRGYVELSVASNRQTVAAGSHRLTAELGVSEEFGWGMVLAVRGQGLDWLPP